MMGKRIIIIIIALVVSVLLLTGCPFDDDDDSNTAEELMTVLAPATLANFDIIVDGEMKTMYIWERCAYGADSTGENQTGFLLETATNCYGAQFLRFHGEGKNFSIYDSVTFKIQVDNTSQAFTFIIQDESTNNSNELDIADYGYDNTQTATFQTITIPIDDLTRNTSIDLLGINIYGQFNVTCTSVQCLTYFSDMSWVLP